MTQLDPSPVMVSAVRAAMVLPMVFLALPAGVLADRVDRRRLLLGTQAIMLCTASLLATLTFLGVMTPYLLLGLTIATGLGMVLHAPTWQASIPELVPRDQLIAAIALGSISFNLARAAGPALGGFVVSAAGSWAAFGINSLSFAGVITVLLLWKRQSTESSGGRSFFASLVDGLRFVIADITIRHVLIRLILYVIPAGGLWALLPLVARESLAWNAGGYGILVGMIGLGAVLGASFIPRLRYRFGITGTLACGHVLTAVTMLTIGFGTGRLTTSLVMLLAGAGWMMTMTTLNSSTQMALPNQFRARGMGCYLTAFAIAMSIGAMLWGFVAAQTSIPTALTIAGITIIATGIVGILLPIGEST